MTCKVMARFQQRFVLPLSLFSSPFLRKTTFNKIAGRYGAPRPPMTDVGTETAFRLDQRKHFRKSKHILRSEVS